MNAKLRVAMLSLSVVMLSACTTTSGLADTTSPTRQDRYVAEVERIARIRGIEVVWVNRPEATEDLVATADD